MAVCQPFNVMHQTIFSPYLRYRKGSERDSSGDHSWLQLITNTRVCANYCLDSRYISYFRLCRNSLTPQSLPESANTTNSALRHDLQHTICTPEVASQVLVSNHLDEKKQRNDTARQKFLGESLQTC